MTEIDRPKVLLQVLRGELDEMPPFLNGDGEDQDLYDQARRIAAEAIALKAGQYALHAYPKPGPVQSETGDDL